MKTRIISGLIMVPLLLLVYFGGLALEIGAVVLSLIGVTEFYNGFENIGVHPSKGIAYVMTAVLYGVYIFIGPNEQFTIAWIMLTVMLSLIYNMDIEKRTPYDSAATALGILYIPFFLYHIILINGSGYSIMTWLVFITAFCTDIMAYFSGYLFGKHKLAPVLSPKKTIEGSIGGIIGSVFFSGLFGYFFIPQLFVHCVLLGIICGIVSQFGDLTASAFKREMGIKDYGTLIPGHGGVMDRFDSVLFTGPIIFYYLYFILGVNVI